jgi:GGDEF domain-containing protein
MIFADRLRAKIANTLTVTVSGGVAVAGEGDTAPTLLTRADTALYSAKAGGRNCVYVNGPDGIERAVAEASGGQSVEAVAC